MEGKSFPAAGQDGEDRLRQHLVVVVAVVGSADAAELITNLIFHAH